METPDPPRDTPGASKKVFLTPHDIPRILRVGNNHSDRKSPWGYLRNSPPNGHVRAYKWGLILITYELGWSSKYDLDNEGTPRGSSHAVFGYVVRMGPPFISHKVRPFGQGTTRSLGDKGSPWWWKPLFRIPGNVTPWSKKYWGVHIPTNLHNQKAWKKPLHPSDLGLCAIEDGAFILQMICIFLKMS